MSEILERLSRTKEVIAFADPLPASLLRSLDSGGVVDPHIWFDLELSVRCVEQLTADLQDIPGPRICDHRIRQSIHSETS